MIYKKKIDNMIKPIIGFKSNNNITLMFVDVMMEKTKKLFHRNFYQGAEKIACIDENEGVFLVAITKNISEFSTIYEVVSDTVEIIRHSLGLDLSIYNDKYLTSEMYNKHFT